MVFLGISWTGNGYTGVSGATTREGALRTDRQTDRQPDRRADGRYSIYRGASQFQSKLLLQLVSLHITAYASELSNTDLFLPTLTLLQLTLRFQQPCHESKQPVQFTIKPVASGFNPEKAPQSNNHNSYNNHENTMLVKAQSVATNERTNEWPCLAGVRFLKLSRVCSRQP